MAEASSPKTPERRVEDAMGDLTLAPRKMKHGPCLVGLNLCTAHALFALTIRSALLLVLVFFFLFFFSKSMLLLNLYVCLSVLQIFSQ